MANSDNRYGLLPYDPAGDIIARTTPYFVPDTDSTDLFIGDAVTIVGGANTVTVGYGRQRQPGSLATVARSTAGATNRITGVIIGWGDIDNPNRLIPLNYRPASTNAVALVCDDPNITYKIQADSQNPIVDGDIGANANLIFTHGGSTINGASGMELDTSSITADATYQLTVLGIVPDSLNELGTNADLLVKINLPLPFADQAGV